MNVGVCVNFVSMETMEHKVKLVREQGFDTIQLLCWDPSLWTEENAVTMKQILEENGVQITEMTDAMYDEFSAAEAPVIEEFTSNELVRAYYDKAISLQ